MEIYLDSQDDFLFFLTGPEPLSSCKELLEINGYRYKAAFCPFIAKTRHHTSEGFHPPTLLLSESKLRLSKRRFLNLPECVQYTLGIYLFDIILWQETFY